MKCGCGEPQENDLDPEVRDADEFTCARCWLMINLGAEKEEAFRISREYLAKQGSTEACSHGVSP